MVSPWGDNVLYEGLRAFNQEDALIREYQQFPRNTIQITGGSQHNEAVVYARRFKKDVPNTRVVYRFGVDDNIHRHWDASTGRFEERMTPEAAAVFLAGIAQGGLVPSYNNEPTKGTLREVVDHALAFMPLLKKRGVEDCIMLNWHTGGIDHLEVRWYPELDELCTAIIEHGYTWGEHNYINTRFMDDPNDPLYCGRYRHIRKRYPKLKVLITEFGFDSHAPNPTYDGYKNHAELWKAIYPGKSTIDVYWDEALKADEAIYAADDVDLLWFCRGHNLTSRWESFNYQQETELINRMKTYRRKAAPVADAYGNRIERGAVALRNMGTFKSLRVRNAATDQGSTVVGALVGGEEVAYYDTVDDNGWRKIEFKGSTAFVFDHYVVITPVVVPPADPNPPFELPIFPEMDTTPEDSERLADYLDWLAQVIRQRGARQLSA